MRCMFLLLVLTSSAYDSSSERAIAPLDFNSSTMCDVKVDDQGRSTSQESV